FILAPGLVDSLAAQETETAQDTTKTGFSLGEIRLPDPNSIVNSYEYDPVLDRYIFTRKVGSFNITQPMILTPEEFQQLVMEEEMQRYFQLKSDALSGKKEGAEESRSSLLPSFYV